jgi:hypothetical protein
MGELITLFTCQRDELNEDEERLKLALSEQLDFEMSSWAYETVLRSLKPLITESTIQSSSDKETLHESLIGLTLPPFHYSLTQLSQVTTALLTLLHTDH